MINSLFQRIKKFEEKNKINLKFDQNFLIDEHVINEFLRFCQFKKTEKIIEVGTGLGFLTERIAPLCQELISIEIDNRFKDYLKFLPKNVKVIFADAYKLFCDKNFVNSLEKIDKIIGNFPYSRLENFLHPLMKDKWFNGNIYIIGPASFVNKVNKNPIFSAYFQAFFIKKIKKTSFYPSPKTVSAIIHLKKIVDPLILKRIDIYIRRFLYEHEDWKLKNCLREAIISAGKDLKNKFITKNQAREIIKKIKISKEELEKKVCSIDLDSYNFIVENLIYLIL